MKLASQHTSGIYSNMELDGPEIGTLVIIVDKAKNLPNRRTMGKQDPYCNARLGKEAKKTHPDRRGGQTPKWDKELRFTVHDSPDYYTLKVSIFDEGKKTELIGEAWVDLQAVIVPGGGELELWQDLKCKGKYAGEVRFELTYYDSRPKVEKPAPAKSRQPADSESLSGSLRQPGVRRRPLPANPTQPDAPRLHAAGPRDLGTPQHRSLEHTPNSQRRNSYNTEAPQLVDQRRPLPTAYQVYEGQDPFVNNDPAGQYLHDPASYGYPEPDLGQDAYQSSQRYDPDNQSRSSRQQYYDEPADFLPQLPPMNRTRDGPSSRRNKIALENDYSQPVPQPPLDHTQSAPIVHPLRLQKSHQTLNHAHSDPYMQHGHDWDQQFPQDHMDSFHPDSQSMGYDGRDGDQFYPDNHPEAHLQHHDEYYGEPQVELPPPPPAHRDTPPREPQHFHSSPGYGQEQDWEGQPRYRGGSYSNTSIAPRDRLRGPLSSKSEVSLARYDDDGEPIPSLGEFRQNQRRSSFEPQHANNDLQQGYGQYSMTQSQNESNFDRSSMYAKGTPSPARKEVPRTPVGPGSYGYDPQIDGSVSRRESYHSNSSHGSYSRNSRHQMSLSQTYPPVQTSPYGNSPQYSAHSINASSTHLPSPSPTKPHPLSQEHTIPSSSPSHYAREDEALHTSAYDPVAVVKPLAISPRKSQPTTPASTDRHSRPTARSATTRKSVSPHPMTSDGRPAFSAYSPESFNALNPSAHSTPGQPPEPAGPIVDFHGNIIDPSDRLPETSWAPEPVKTTPSKDPSDHLPSSSWAPEPHGRRQSEPRMITVRAREKVNGARASPNTSAFNVNVSCNAQRHSMYGTGPRSGGSTPADTGSPATRNRLRKLPRPQSMATSPWSSGPNSPHDQHRGSVDGYGNPSAGGYGSGPPIPAKIPLEGPPDGNQGLVRYHGSATSRAGNDVDRLSMEMSSIDIGGVRDSESRRMAGGRRLLGYNG